MNRSALIGKVLVPLLCLAAGGFVGFPVRDRIARSDEKREFSAIREGAYRFISPLLECDSDRDVLRNRELHPFKQKVEDYLRSRMLFPSRPMHPSSASCIMRPT